MFGNKSAFGTGNTFGSGTFGNAATPFGQSTSAFGAGKPLGTTFGTQPFGSGQATNSIFGSPSGQSNMFGAGTATSTFGQPSSSTNAGFGFSATPSGTGLFGSTNQQSTGTGLFSNATGSAFGTPKPTFGGGFSSGTPGTSLFSQAQPQQQQQQPSMFNTSGTAAQTSLFGGSTFGNAGAGATNGTTVKFVPVTGSDTMMKNGLTTSISTRHLCITVMKDYENKSLEELRVEDYLANRKGPAQGTTIGGGFGTGASSTLFGSTPAVPGSTGLFGQTPNKTFFGTNQTNGFGTSTTGLFGQQAPQNVSPFNKPLGFGAPATTQNSSFGFGNTTSTFGTANQQNKPLFGGTTLPSTSGTSLFGNAAGTQQAPAFGSGTFAGGFGTQNQNASPFGVKPMGFGAVTTTASGFPAFGTNTASTAQSFLFNKQTTTSFVTPFGSTNTGFTGFGNPANTGSSLFGQKPQQGFGTGFGGGLGTGGSSLFGSTANKPGSLNLNAGGFGTNPSTGFGTNAGLGLGASNFNFGGGNTTLGSDPNASQFGSPQAPITQQLLGLAVSPYGNSSLFKNIVQDPGSNDELLRPTNPQAQKALTSAIQYKFSPRPVVKLKPRPLLGSRTGKSSLFDGFDEEDDTSSKGSFVPRRSIKKLVLKSRPSVSSSTLSNTLDETVANEGNSSLLENETQALTPELGATLGSRESDSRGSPTLILNPLPPVSTTNSGNRRINFDNTIAALNNNRGNRRASPEKSPPQVDSLLNVTSEEESDQSAVEDGEVAPHPAGIILQKPGYYTIPSLEELATLVEDNGDCFVENFTIGREGYGNVHFPGITNVANLNLDELVHFRRKEVIVYPNDDLKPQFGQGLNKKAQITLDCVWPTDKTNHMPITSPDRLRVMKYQQKLENATAKLKAKFMEYRPESGSWVFQVNHFSKYGLEDSDDDDMSSSPQASQPPKDLLLQQQLKHIANGGAQMLTQSLQMNGDHLPTVTSFTQLEATAVPLRLRNQEQDDKMEGIMNKSFPIHIMEDEEENESFMPASHRLVEVVGASTQRVQAMKASLFWDETEEDDNDEMFENRMDRSGVPGNLVPSLDISKTNLGIGADKSISSHSDYLSSVASTTMEPAQHLRFQVSSSQDYGHRSKFAKFSGSLSRMPMPVAQPPIEMLSKFTLLEGSGAQPEATFRANAMDKAYCLLPLSKSILADKSHLISDAACMMGRTFRVGWGPNFTISHLGKSLAEQSTLPGNSKILKPFDLLNAETNAARRGLKPFSVITELMSCLPSYAPWDDVKKMQIDQYLNTQLIHSKIGIEDGCPYVLPRNGEDIIHQHAKIAADLVQNMSSVHPDYEFLQQAQSIWELAVALWGKLSDEHEQIDKMDTYNYHMSRREAFSAWLTATSKPKIIKENQEHKNNIPGHLSTVFSHLTGLQIPEAVLAAQDSRDLFLALHLAQAGGSVELRETSKKQLNHWLETKSDHFINADRMKINAVLSGALVWKSSEMVINTCENLDWKRALSLHLWYQCSPVATIADALQEYDEAYKGETQYGCYASPPYPPYLENVHLSLKSKVSPDDEDLTKFPVYDTCYHLLKLYVDRSHRLDCLLTPTTYTFDPLDHRLSWLLSQALKAIGYTYLSDLQDSSLHVNFATQLASAGLWQWSAFVLLHLNDPMRRKAAILDLLRRHISKSSDDSEIERFCTDVLLIPREWLFEAKAIRAKRENDVHAEAFYLLESGHWNQSHKLIVRYIAPDVIINENYDYLKSLLEKMAPPEHNALILDWNIGGQVFLDYIHLSQTVNRIVKGELSAYELEGLQPEVTSLCNRIASLQCHTAKDRLCITEMAKKTANLLRAVLSLGSGMTAIPSRLLTPHINKLPLPEDYGIQELRALTQSCFLEMT